MNVEGNKMKNHKRLFIGFGVFLFIAGAFSPTGAQQKPAPAAAASILANGSFEEMDTRWPKGWRTANFQARAAFAVDETVARTGKRSVRISSDNGADSGFQTAVEVKPYSKYRLSGWVKTQDLAPGTGKGALLNLHNMDVMTGAVSGTKDWTRVEATFDSGATDAVLINCLFGGWGRATGTAWFDDIALELLSSRPANPRAAIDAAKTLAPISKYIYGQFIEHLGRCIYQGIWAEMLEDRKFYYPVGDKESPWKAVGDARNVRMNPILPYVGVHAPQVRVKGTGEAGGIVQEKLAVIAGKDYVGRVVVAGDPGAAPVQASLVWGGGPNDRQTVQIADLASDYKTIPLAFRAGASSEEACLEIVSTGSEAFRVGTVSLMPADNVDGFRPDVLDLLRKLNSPVYRWPGGNFVSGYNWKEGLGDPDKRPPRKNPAWLGVEHNDVGIHEFLNFCRLIATEPYITVNSGQGNETLAAEEVEYTNGSVETPMGKWRMSNGHPAPWGVTFWSVGNEMYGNWQLGYMPLADYTKRHNRFAQAMRAKDPSIKIVAVGSAGPWTEGMLKNSAEAMDYISEHFYVQSLPGALGHANLAPREVKSIADAHRKYRETIPGLKGKNILVALDEWNYWYGPYVYGELGTQYFLKDALGVAAGLHEYFRQSDIIFMANYAQTVNVIGAIKTSKTAATFDSTGVVLELYRNHFGSIPVKVSGEPAPLDVAAAWTEGKKTLTLAVVNATKTAQTLPISFSGVRVPRTAKLYLVTGADEMACNVPGKEPGVTVREVPNAPFGKKLTLPPISVSLYEIK
jgi:alpha-N-arabinofuranosidase